MLENKVKRKQGRPVNRKEEGKGKKEEEVQKSNPSNGASKKTGKSVKKEVKESLEKDLTDDEEIVVNKDERLALKQIAEFLQKAKLPLSPFPVTKGKNQRCIFSPRFSQKELCVQNSGKKIDHLKAVFYRLYSQCRYLFGLNLLFQETEIFGTWLYQTWIRVHGFTRHGFDAWNPNGCLSSGDGNCWYRAMSNRVSMLGIPIFCVYI